MSAGRSDALVRDTRATGPKRPQTGPDHSFALEVATAATAALPTSRFARRRTEEGALLPKTAPCRVVPIATDLGLHVDRNHSSRRLSARADAYKTPQRIHCPCDRSSIVRAAQLDLAHPSCAQRRARIRGRESQGVVSRHHPMDHDIGFQRRCTNGSPCGSRDDRLHVHDAGRVDDEVSGGDPSVRTCSLRAPGSCLLLRVLVLGSAAE